jgi:hypothetical protein
VFRGSGKHAGPRVGHGSPAYVRAIVRRGFSAPREANCGARRVGLRVASWSIEPETLVRRSMQTAASDIAHFKTARFNDLESWRGIHHEHRIHRGNCDSGDPGTLRLHARRAALEGASVADGHGLGEQTVERGARRAPATGAVVDARSASRGKIRGTCSPRRPPSSAPVEVRRRARANGRRAPR